MEPLSLEFSPTFGAPHEDPDKTVRYYRDTYLCGRTLSFDPDNLSSRHRTTVEIGRHAHCWARIGRNGVTTEDGHEIGSTDSQGYEFLSTFSRVHCTFVWADATHYPWLHESKWLILLGGVFVGPGGRKESSLPRNGVYLNGKRLSDADNPEPLFAAGSSIAKVSLGVTGRIIIFNHLRDEHTTGLPASIWTGEGWPNDPPAIKATPGRRLEIEQQVATEKMPETPTTIPPQVKATTWAEVVNVVLKGPEGVPASLWWFFLTLAGLAALWIWKHK